MKNLILYELRSYSIKFSNFSPASGCQKKAFLENRFDFNHIVPGHVAVRSFNEVLYHKMGFASGRA